MSLTDWMTGIQHVGIPTNDIEKTIAFYEALGFRNIYRTRNEAAGEAVCFLQMKNLCIETYQTGKAALKAGAVDHIAIDVTDIEEAYRVARELGCPFFEEGISFLPFWERGIRSFILLGPNQEKIEFCQKLST